MAKLNANARANIEVLLNQYKDLLAEAEKIKFINKQLNQSYQDFYQACLIYGNDLRTLDEISESKGRYRTKDLEHACSFLKKMNDVASKYEKILDYRELIRCFDDIFANEIRRLPEQIAYYSLTVLLFFSYIAAVTLMAAVIVFSFTPSLTALIVGLAAGFMVGILLAYKDAEPTAYNKTYHFFRPYDAEPEKKAIHFMNIAKCNWGHESEEYYDCTQNVVKSGHLT